MPSPVRGLGGIRDLRGFYGRTVYVAIWGLGSGLRVKTGVGTSDLESCALVPKPDLTFDSIARVGKSEPGGHEVDNKRGGGVTDVDPRPYRDPKPSQYANTTRMRKRSPTALSSPRGGPGVKQGHVRLCKLLQRPSGKRIFSSALADWECLCARLGHFLALVAGFAIGFNVRGV